MTVKCPHCQCEIEIVQCGECLHEAPEEEMEHCDECGNRYCDEHINDHECWDETDYGS